MRILFITPYPYSVIRRRPYELLRGLLRRGHAVTLAAGGVRPGDPAVQLASSDGLRNVHTWSVGGIRRASSLVGALARDAPLQARYDWQPAMARGLVKLVQRDSFDVAHIEHLRGAIYGEALRGLLPVVWDSVDCISDLFEQAARSSVSRRGRWTARFELARTRRHEARLVRTFYQTVVTSEHDRACLLALANGTVPSHRVASAVGVDGSAVTVVPNGVDLTYFSPDDTIRDTDTVLFSGKMSYHANVTAARYLVTEVMPLVWAERPDVRLVLAGAEPAPEVRSLAARHRARVEVTGYVADLRPLLRSATVAVAPIVYGVGIQNKVLEAMACATPVVASCAAVRALAAQPGTEVLVAGTAGDMARDVLSLLSAPDRAAALGAAGRVYVERHHDWSDSVTGLEACYARGMAQFASAKAEHNA